MSDTVLANLHDVENVSKLCKEEQVCPYYTSRYAVNAAQLVLLPYQMLLHEGTRRASGVSVEGNVVIVDEAHNLLEAIAAAYSSQISLQQVKLGKSQLSDYALRYQSRLKSKNLTYVRELLSVMQAFISFLDSKTSEEMLKVPDFLFRIGLADTNFFKILTYARKTEIAKKLRGFAMKYSVSPVIPKPASKKCATMTGAKKLSGLFSKNTAALPLVNEPAKPTEFETPRSGSSPMYQIISFLEALTLPADDGRILLENKDGDKKLRFLLLNPSSQLSHLVKPARAVVLAGGTMEPCQELKDGLRISCGIPKERLICCGHVIEKTQLLPIAVSVGPSGANSKLKFDFESRSRFETIDELGRVLLNLVRIVPAGMVVFFVSYDYLESVVKRLTTNGSLEKISTKKKVFVEPRKASEVEKVLSEYSGRVRFGEGSVLLGVVGGKMSEGINFSDDMGRCVVVVGLPFPNKNSLQLREKLRYLQTQSDNKDIAQQHYENICMKAVNQSIGRAIRHKNDYATIVLLDERYASQRISSKLPHWISELLTIHDKTFGSVIGCTRQFFNAQTK